MEVKAIRLKLQILSETVQLERERKREGKKKKRLWQM